MKVFVKTLKGTHFEIEVKPEDTVTDVKKNIETVQGSDVYPAAQQMLIHQGKVLKDATTLEEIKVAENSFIVIMLSKSKVPSGQTLTETTAPKAPQTSAPSPVPAVTQAPPPAVTQPAVPSAPASDPATVVNAQPENVYDQAASNLVAGSNLEGTTQQILDMGGGIWDRDTVVRALRAAFNNPERAVDYLYSGIPETAELPPAAGASPVPGVQAVNPPPPAQPPQATQPAAVPSTGPNANPLDLFPQGLPDMGANAPAGAAGNLDFLRNSPQVVVMPYARVGHINPLLNLCRTLSSRSGVTTCYTLFVPKEWYEINGSCPKPDNIQFATFRYVYPKHLEPCGDGDPRGFFSREQTVMAKQFALLLEEMERPVDFIIADVTLGPKSFDLANKKDIPVAAYWPMSASAFLFLYYQETYFLKTCPNVGFGKSAKKREVAANKVTYKDDYGHHIPGLSQTRVGDFPWMVDMPKIASLDPFRNRAKFLLLATIYELEGAAVDEIISKIDIPVYVVGPNIPHLRIQTILPSTQSSCYYSWLESKTPKSVLYISLGSLEFVPGDQIVKIVAGLKRSGVAFLWATWGETSLLGADIGSNGLVVEWCDQARVLLNGSIGGFLTHCGWNSIKESLYAGVPMLNFPIRGDQPFHCKLVHQDWEVGHNLKIDDTLEEVFKDFMVNSRTILLEKLKGVEGVFRKSMEDYKEADCFIKDSGLMLDAPAAAMGADQVVIMPLPEIGAVTNLRSRPHWLFSKKLPIAPVKMLFGRQMNQNGRSRFTSSDRCYLSSEHLYGKMSIIDKVESEACVSQFSDDGRLLVASFLNGDMKIYSVENSWRTVKHTRLTHFSRRITDTPLSPDQHYIAYSSSESPVLGLVNIFADGLEMHDEELQLSSADVGGIFSVKFSHDGRELAAASADKAIYVYDLLARRLFVRIQAHKSHVNTVCFADETSNIIYSGSDDHLCKVWDRRSLGTQGKSCGVLSGHLQGITSIDSHGDGRYFISNGKDQCIKLWDIRKMTSDTCGLGFATSLVHFDWDYDERYPQRLSRRRHPSDQSLGTYKGHKVNHTLIRCYFSPLHSTGQKFIYTGSSNGFIYVYDMVTGELVARPRQSETVVRDCSWHPWNNMLAGSSWDGQITKWEFVNNTK